VRPVLTAKTTPTSCVGWVFFGFCFYCHATPDFGVGFDVGFGFRVMPLQHQMFPY
jgi:hypothetical protein